MIRISTRHRVVGIKAEVEEDGEGIKVEGGVGSAEVEGEDLGGVVGEEGGGDGDSILIECVV
jgi:hypothetical protein